MGAKNGVLRRKKRYLLFKNMLAHDKNRKEQRKNSEAMKSEKAVKKKRGQT